MAQISASYVALLPVRSYKRTCTKCILVATLTSKIGIGVLLHTHTHTYTHTLMEASSIHDTTFLLSICHSSGGTAVILKMRIRPSGSRREEEEEEEAFTEGTGGGREEGGGKGGGGAGKGGGGAGRVRGPWDIGGGNRGRGGN